MTSTYEVLADADTDQGPPMERWAVLNELAAIGRLDSRGAPAQVHFIERANDRPILSLTFDTNRDAMAWISWFGRHPEIRDGWPDYRGRIDWRGYRIALHGPGPNEARS